MHGLDWLKNIGPRYKKPEEWERKKEKMFLTAPPFLEPVEKLDFHQKIGRWSMVFFTWDHPKIPSLFSLKHIPCLNGHLQPSNNCLQCGPRNQTIINTCHCIMTTFSISLNEFQKSKRGTNMTRITDSQRDPIGLTSVKENGESYMGCKGSPIVIWHV